MPMPSPLRPVDYLVIGHLACDQTAEGLRLGGTAAYAALTAKALGLRVGVITVWGGELPLTALDGIQWCARPAERSTTFENRYTDHGRIQFLHHQASLITPRDIPPLWQQASIIHIGPIAQETGAAIFKRLRASLLGVTPQGWLRTWDKNGRVYPCEWPEAHSVLKQVDAAVISLEDVNGEESRIEAMAANCPVLAVTEGAGGARLYWGGDQYHFRALPQVEVDATGAGDIFAAAFFSRLYSTHNPWEAARFATHLASFSVTRSGLEGIPRPEEIQACLTEVW